jgi:hypothetical protein
MTPMSHEQRVETIARCCHEANKAWCEAHGDGSQSGWTWAEQWQRDSAIKGVQVALDGATPEQQHDAWTADKIADSWVYGPFAAHPCLVPYEQLPEFQRATAAMFGAIVRALAPALGLP